ncbi:hypothetical protein FOG48_02278 [Hanseniaspora uvarum]|nr:hypothetical protein FOG48_02278 [Hanseniaspora uvarum]GMM39136.1 hypothetical protein DAHU10_000370 [Hanseniaspora uvarum]
MLFQDTKLILNLLPNEVSISYITNNQKQFVKTVPLIYTQNNKTDELTFGLNETILLKQEEFFETFQILDSNFNVIVKEEIFESFVNYIFANILYIDDWKADISILKRIMIFQSNIPESINYNTFANKLRQLFLNNNISLASEVYQIDSDYLTSMFYSTTAEIEKANIVINIQESFSSSSIYINGIETYKKKTMMSGSFLNFQLSSKGELTRDDTSVNNENSLTQWKDSTTWLTKARNLMMNFVILNSFEKDEVKTYYNSNDLDYLTYQDKNLKYKIKLDSLEEIKKTFLFDNYTINQADNKTTTVKSINALLKDVFEIGLASNVQLFNKDTNEDENEKQGKSKAELDQEQQKLSDFITQNYPVKEKSYSYKIIPSKNEVKINKVILQIAPTLLLIPHFESSIKKLVNKYISDSSVEVIFDTGFDNWFINSKFAINCNDRDMLLTFNKN